MVPSTNRAVKAPASLTTSSRINLSPPTRLLYKPLPSIRTPSPPPNSQVQAASTPPSLPMADQQTPQDCATTFLQDHTSTVPATDLPLHDECPICLDTYTLEHSVRVNIPGCGHVFGHECLTVILTDNPNLVKKCPLCRTVWVPGAENDRSAILDDFARWPDRRSMLQFLRPTAHVERPHPRQGFAVPRVARSRPAAGERQMRNGDVINLVDSDEDGDVRIVRVLATVFSRDIADIRSRARNTQLSRKQRKDEENARKQNQSQNAEGSRSGLARANSQHANADADQPTPRRFEGLARLDDPPIPRYPHIENMIKRNWYTASSQNGNGNGHANGEPPPARAADIPTGAPRRVTPLSADFLNLQRSNAQRAFVSPAPLFLRHAPPPPPSPGAFVLSPSPMLASPSPDSSDAEANRVQKARLGRREKELNESEKRLGERERGLDERDRALFQREQRVAQREQGETRATQMRQRQLHEMETMFAKHRDEMRKM